MPKAVKTKGKPRKAKFGYKGHYGMELILDLKGCDLKDLSKKKLRRFFVELCDLIDMKRHGEPIYWEDNSGIPHLHGTSGVQLIETSNIVCHPLPMLKAVYLNVFSCKSFEPEIAIKFCVKFWGAKSYTKIVVPRI